MTNHDGFPDDLEDDEPVGTNRAPKGQKLFVIGNLRKIQFIIRSVSDTYPNDLGRPVCDIRFERRNDVGDALYNWATIPVRSKSQTETVIDNARQTIADDGEDVTVYAFKQVGSAYQLIATDLSRLKADPSTKAKAQAIEYNHRSVLTDLLVAKGCTAYEFVGENPSAKGITFYYQGLNGDGLQTVWSLFVEISPDKDEPVYPKSPVEIAWVNIEVLKVYHHKEAFYFEFKVIYRAKDRLGNSITEVYNWGPEEYSSKNNSKIRDAFGVSNVPDIKHATIHRLLTNLMSNASVVLTWEQYAHLGWHTIGEQKQKFWLGANGIQEQGVFFQDSRKAGAIPPSGMDDYAIPEVMVPINWTTVEGFCRRLQPCAQHVVAAIVSSFSHTMLMYWHDGAPNKLSKYVFGIIGKTGMGKSALINMAHRLAGTKFHARMPDVDSLQRGHTTAANYLKAGKYAYLGRRKSDWKKCDTKVTSPEKLIELINSSYDATEAEKTTNRGQDGAPRTQETGTGFITIERDPLCEIKGFEDKDSDLDRLCAFRLIHGSVEKVSYEINGDKTSLSMLGALYREWQLDHDADDTLSAILVSAWDAACQDVEDANGERDAFDHGKRKQKQHALNLAFGARVFATFLRDRCSNSDFDMADWIENQIQDFLRELADRALQITGMEAKKDVSEASKIWSVFRIAWQLHKFSVHLADKHCTPAISPNYKTDDKPNAGSDLSPLVGQVDDEMFWATPNEWRDIIPKIMADVVGGPNAFTTYRDFLISEAEKHTASATFRFRPLNGKSKQVRCIPIPLSVMELSDDIDETYKPGTKKEDTDGEGEMPPDQALDAPPAPSNVVPMGKR